MTPEHHEKFSSLENIRLRILYHVTPWDDMQFNAKPSDGKWSVGQVIFHLVQVEQFSVSYVNKKIKYPEALKTTGFGTSLRYSLLKFFLHLPVKYKAPVQVAKVPENLNKEELLKQWEDTRKEMALLLDRLPVEMHDKNIFKHLIAGRMNIAQMLDFIHHHINHHLPQIIK